MFQTKVVLFEKEQMMIKLIFQKLIFQGHIKVIVIFLNKFI